MTLSEHSVRLLAQCPCTDISMGLAVGCKSGRKLWLRSSPRAGTWSSIPTQWRVRHIQTYRFQREYVGFSFNCLTPIASFQTLLLDRKQIRILNALCHWKVDSCAEIRKHIAAIQKDGDNNALDSLVCIAITLFADAVVLTVVWLCRELKRSALMIMGSPTGTLTMGVGSMLKISHNGKPSLGTSSYISAAFLEAATTDRS